MPLADVLVLLAFVFRATALLAAILLFVHFSRSTGTIVRPMCQVLAAFIFLLTWVSIASVAELLSVWPHAGYMVEYGAKWIWLPNAIITAGLFRLLAYLWARDGTE